MRLSILQAISFIMAVGLLTACGRSTPAPLVYGTESARSATAAPETKAPAAAIDAGVHVVAADETLYAVARRSGVALRDLIQANKLRPPYRLDKGQRLTIPGVRYHRVAAGETLYGISRRYSVSPYALARTNRVAAPYKIRPGQKLRLPASEAKLAVRRPANTAPQPRRGEALKPVIKPPPKRAGGRFAWPVEGRVISRFGAKANGLHNDGINIAVREGTVVRAADNGVVVYAGNELRGFGNLLLLRHRGGWVTAYGHNQSLDVRVGDVVRRGQRIARAGSTGNITRAQLHFEIRKGRRAVNPARYLAVKQVLVDPHTHAAGQVLDELPGDPAVAGAPGHGPFDGLGAQVIFADVEGIMFAIARQHGEKFILAAIVEAQPQTEAVGKGDLLLHRLGRIDRGGAFILHHVAGHQMAAVRGGVENDVAGPPLDTSLQHGLE
jgi:murein DD-endopeptidase MepM/ murein hydrolase activator NlpD